MSPLYTMEPAEIAIFLTHEDAEGDVALAAQHNLTTNVVWSVMEEGWVIPCYNEMGHLLGYMKRHK